MAATRFVLAAAAVLACAGPAAAGVTVATEIFVERTDIDAEGEARTSLEPMRALSRGERLRFVVRYANSGPRPAADLVLTNPVPRMVAFAGAAGAAELSVDGGRSWGKLEELAVQSADGSLRPAGAADVTHIRWRIATPVPAGAAGELSYRAVAR